MICACCRKQIEQTIPYRDRVKRALLLLKLRYMIENPQPTKVYVERSKRARRETDKASLDRAA